MEKEYEYKNGKFSTVIGESFREAKISETQRQILERLLLRETEENVVSSREYLDWLCDFAKLHETYDDETFLYDKDGEIKEKILKISYLQLVIVHIARKLKIESIAKNKGVEEYRYTFKYKDNYFTIVTIVGQGATTFITKIPKEEATGDIIVLLPV